MSASEDLNSALNEQKTVLLGIYQENRSHVRHLESQRATASNIIIVTTVSLAGVMGINNLTCADWPLTVALIILGIYGTMFTAIHYECIRSYRLRAGECCKALEVLLSKREKSSEEQTQEMLKKILNMSDCEHEEKLPQLRELPFLTKVRALWPLTISIIGIIATFGIVLFKCGG